MPAGLTPVPQQQCAFETVVDNDKENDNEDYGEDHDLDLAGENPECGREGRIPDADVPLEEEKEFLVSNMQRAKLL